MSETEAASSSSEPPTTAVPDDNNKIDEEFVEPDKKRRRLEKKPNKTDKLEHRLGGILCCAVCLDLPRTAIYQLCALFYGFNGSTMLNKIVIRERSPFVVELQDDCTTKCRPDPCSNGHLMCAGCFTHVLADARLRDETATCPNCRIEIGKTTASRNLAVEKAVCELPAECQFCGNEFPRNTLEKHEDECEEKITGCKYSRIGCPWRGPAHEAVEHEGMCTHPHRSGAEVMNALQLIDLKFEEEKLLYNTVFELLSYEKITFNDLQMKPYRTEEFIHRLFYETSRFSAFNNQWVVKARINNSQKDPTQSSERDMTYQLILKTKITCPLSLHYVVLKGPFGDMKVQPRIYKFDFTDQDNESPYMHLPLSDTAECNRLLATKAINFRLIMFQASK